MNTAGCHSCIIGIKKKMNLEGYDGDLYLLLKFLIPVADQRVYNLKAKQLIKIFSSVSVKF